MHRLTGLPVKSMHLTNPLTPVRSEYIDLTCDFNGGLRNPAGVVLGKFI